MKCMSESYGNEWTVQLKKNKKKNFNSFWFYSAVFIIAERDFNFI